METLSVFVKFISHTILIVLLANFYLTLQFEKHRVKVQIDMVLDRFWVLL